MSSPHLPPGLDTWTISFDPFGCAASPDWGNAVEPQEDILQIQHVYLKRVVDLGHYGDGFVLQLIENEDWDTPKEQMKLPSLGNINAHLTRLLTEHAG